MSNLQRDISTENMKITEFVDELRKDKFLIPTFQREFVWEPDNIIKLWDSIFRFYPIGSVLYWVTDSYLHTHRQLGGFEFPHDEDIVRQFETWKYVLDGQQRATSLLVSMLGGKGRVEDDEDFDYTLHFDLTTGEFLFPSKLSKKREEVPDEFLVRLRDVPEWTPKDFFQIASAEDYCDEVESNLNQIFRIFSDYKLSLIRIKGVEVNEVCEIFERINQEGKKLDPFDIIVARTYRVEDEEKGQSHFYLREKTEALYDTLTDRGSRFQELEPLTIVQMFAMCLRKDHPRGSKFGTTPAALDNLRTRHFDEYWDRCEQTILDTAKFLSDMRIHGPAMLPYIYLIHPICYYLYQNKSPNRSMVRQWFWATTFSVDSFRNARMVYDFSKTFFGALEDGKMPNLPPIAISPRRLVERDYRSRSASSRAVMAFLAAQKPKSFIDPEAEVLDNVYLNLSQAPNLHHVYPRSFLSDTDLPEDIGINSLMNICFLRARINIQIGGSNPLTYFEEFRSKVPNFDSILDSHLIPKEFTTRDSFEPEDYRDFLYARADMFIDALDEALPDVQVIRIDEEQEEAEGRFG